MSEMKVSQEDLAARAWAWRGVAAGKASRFRPNRALSWGAKTNGAVYAAPGGSRHRLYHRTAQTRGTSCARRRRWSGPPCARWRARLRRRLAGGGIDTKQNRFVAETARWIKIPRRLLTSCPSFVPSFFPPKKIKPVIEAVARATGRGADSSVGPGAPRQRPARHETRRRAGADPAPCVQARAHVLRRDLHLAQHHLRRRHSAPTPGSAAPKRL